MPVLIHDGDLLDSGAQVLFHGCNCFKTMGAGVALALRTRYPEVYTADLDWMKPPRERLGHFTKAKTKSGIEIYNLYTQFEYGRRKRMGEYRVDADYKAIRNSLAEMKADLDALDPAKKQTIAGPLIGCGLAGGDWMIVENLIETTFPDRTINIWKL